MKLLLALLIATALVGPKPADAVTLQVSPPSQTQYIGTELNVAIEVSGLESLSLNQFIGRLWFDPLIVHLTGVSFGDPLLGDQIALSGGNDGIFSNIFSDNVDFSEYSHADAADLLSLQANSFIIVSLRFSAIGKGTSPITLSSADLNDEIGNSISFDVENGSVTVVPVPEVNSFIMFVTGIVLVMLLRHTAQCSR
jgi:hypothetical protein